MGGSWYGVGTALVRTWVLEVVENELDMRKIILQNTDNKKVGVLCIVAFLCCLSVGCRTVRVQVEPPELDRDQVWRLVEMQGRKLDRGAARVTIVFNPETGSLHGSAACNTYSANYLLSLLGDDDATSRKWMCSLSISGLECTSVQCPDAEMNSEARYLSRLRHCNRLSLADAGNTLILGTRDRAELIFELQ